MRRTSSYWIEQLGLRPHPEGGYFAETYRSDGSIPRSALPARFDGDRPFSTSIYYLLEEGSFSALHRIRSDELWYWHDGGPLTICVLGEGSSVLGLDAGAGERPQRLVKAGRWFGAEPRSGAGYALVSCSVSPGFDFRDFEMGERGVLLREFPADAELIGRLTRP